MKEYILEKNLIGAKFVEKILPTHIIWLHIKEVTQMKDITNVKRAEKILHTPII